MTMAFYGLKMQPYMELYFKNEEIENFMDMYIGCDVSLLPITLQNVEHQHIKQCKKKITCYLQIPLSITPHEYNKNITSIQKKSKLLFSKKSLHLNKQQFFKSFKNFKINENITLSNFS